jgi:heavy metal translocating P-type ATPase
LKTLALILSGIGLIVSLFIKNLPVDPAWIAVVLCGIPIIIGAVVGLIREHDITADVLVAMALLAAVAIGEIFAAGEVALIMQLGANLEERTVEKARAGIEKLVRLKPRTARIISSDGTESTVPTDAVATGDRLRVNPGETIPVDGVIVSGHTSVNQAVMTGESLPVDKRAGDEVASGTVNQFGSFEMTASRVGADSSLQRMIRLVESADAGKSKVASLADRWAVWIVVIALASAGATWLVTGEIIRAVTILVVFCPCSLVLATPTAIMAAIGNVSKKGILVRDGGALERLSGVSRIAFDKTGTLTIGRPEVIGIESLDASWTPDSILRTTASVEQYSEHPLGKAIVASYIDQNLPVTDFKMVPGIGVSGQVAGQAICAGNPESLNTSPTVAQQNKIRPYLSEGASIIYVQADGKLIGFIALADTIRTETPGVISRLKEMATPVLLTGDHAAAAEHIASLSQIDDTLANCRPEDKLAYIKKQQAAGTNVCMIGDGVNDAPALKLASVGIAMGDVGSDIAIDAADIVLVSDSVAALPHLFALSKHMMRVITFNLSFSMLLNFLAITLAIVGVLNPVIGALVHNAGSVFVIVNSALLLNWRERPSPALSENPAPAFQQLDG